MSRKSDAKKARRRKRQAARGNPRSVEAGFSPDAAEADERPDTVAGAVALIDEWLAGRGWVVDPQHSGEVVSWVYPPSAAEFDDEEIEPVTRIWITVEEDDDEVAVEFGAALVGGGEGDGPYLLDPDHLPEDVAVLEAYRAGDPDPWPN